MRTGSLQGSCGFCGAITYWIAEGHWAKRGCTQIPAGLLHRLGMSTLGFKGLQAAPSRDGTQSCHIEEEVEVIRSANTGGG